MKAAFVTAAVLLAGVALVSAKPDPGWTFFDDFSDGLSSENWLVAYKQWGGKDVNGGVHPENVVVEDGVLKLKVNGDKYDGPLRGVNKDMSIREDGKRVGAAIASAKFFASGKYEIRMKVAPVMGVCSALWTFNYEEYYPGDDEYEKHCKDTPIRCNPDYWASNSEIDMEFPTALTDGGSDISFENGRLNSWIGENVGEYQPNFLPMGVNVNDGQFHTFRFDWHTGDEDRMQEKRVDFYIDDRLVKTIEGEYTPTVSGRLWLGAWFPDQWAGNPDFDQAELEIDWVRIRPFHEDGDDWFLPSYPDIGWSDAFPYPSKTPFFDDFSAETLDPAKWKVVEKTWGGQLGKKPSWNGGVLPENVKLTEKGTLLLEAHGNLYDGPVLGMNRGRDRRNDGTRVGSGIATTPYFGSAKYEAKMRVCPEKGVVTAMWTFNYEEYYPPDPRYEQYCPNKPEYCVVNHEVDFEMPTSLNKTEPSKGVSFNNGRLNVFTGVEEDQMQADFVPLGIDAADGQFHVYRFDWHTSPKRVDWFIDDKLIHSIEGDAVPTNAGRFWIAAWFAQGWAGKAHFNTSAIELDWVKITPLNEDGDTVLPETYPIDGFAQRAQYPRIVRDPSKAPEANAEPKPIADLFPPFVPSARTNLPPLPQMKRTNFFNPGQRARR